MYAPQKLRLWYIIVLMMHWCTYKWYQKVLIHIIKVNNNNSNNNSSNSKPADIQYEKHQRFLYGIIYNCMPSLYGESLAIIFHVHRTASV